MTSTPKTISIAGSGLTGTDGTANRTYTISDTNVLTAGMSIIINGTSLHIGSGKDYTVSSTTITFLNIVDDTDVITINYFVGSAAASSASVSTLTLTKYLLLLGTVPNKTSTSLELVGVGDGSTTAYWLDNCGVLADTYTLSYGSSATSTTALTETTHYTIDLDTSEVTLTAAGVTAISGSNLYASYSYNKAELSNTVLQNALNSATDKVTRDTGMTFSESTDSDQAYRKITNELKKGHYNTYEKVYDFYWSPLVKIQTTVNGAYTTGGTTLTLDDASLLPSSGTIYVGGNKVAYTAKSSNDLTVPSTTPSISDGATVRGEVIELSSSSEGTSPSYTVLDPDTEYEIDYDNGRIKVLNEAYYSETNTEATIFPNNYLIRVSYMHAWHEAGANPTIPDDIKYALHAIAARDLKGEIVGKSTMLGVNTTQQLSEDIEVYLSCLW